MKFDVKHQGSGWILDVEGQRGVGGLENWAIFMDVMSSLNRIFFLKKRPNNLSFLIRFRHIVWCVKSWTRLFLNFSSIVRFSGSTYKAENLHALWHEQNFSKHRFLDICQCAFNIKIKLTIIGYCLSHENIKKHCDKKSNCVCFYNLGEENF